MDANELSRRAIRGTTTWAELGSWPLIRKLGLLSTEALVDAFGESDEARVQILAQRRPTDVTIGSSTYGPAVVRDQIPLRESVLARVLDDGMQPADWCRMLNGFVFLWPTRKRLDRLLDARAYRDRPNDVLVFDTGRLVIQAGGRVFLSAINSGSTLLNARPRGRSTFVHLRDYPYEERRRERGVGGAIAEVAVRDRVSPALPSLLRVERRLGPAVVELLLEL